METTIFTVAAAAAATVVSEMSHEEDSSPFSQLQSAKEIGANRQTVLLPGISIEEGSRKEAPDFSTTTTTTREMA